MPPPADGYVCDSCVRGANGVRWIEPPFCDCCGLPYDGDITVSFVCANCRGMKMHFRSARAAAKFSGVVKEAIHAYKYNHAIWHEAFLANLLARAARPHLAPGDWDFLVPIPLHWTRRIERSFNQAHRLARALSRITGIPVRSNLLRRTQRAHVQALLSREARAENVKRAFAFTGKGSVEGARIVLIDDVLTTGATANACAKVLRQNGAAVVDVWTVARNLLK